MGNDEEKDLDKRQETEADKLVAEVAEDGPDTNETEQTSEDQSTDIQPVQRKEVSEEQVETQMEQQNEDEGNNAEEEDGEAGDQVKEEVAEAVIAAGQEHEHQEEERGEAEGRFDDLRELKDIRNQKNTDNAQAGEPNERDQLKKGIRNLRRGDLYGAVVVARQLNKSNKISNPFHSTIAGLIAKGEKVLDVSADINSGVAGITSVLKPFAKADWSSTTVSVVSTISNAWSMVTTFKNFCKKLKSLVDQLTKKQWGKSILTSLGLAADTLNFIAKGVNVAASTAKLFKGNKAWTDTVTKRVVPWLNAGAQIPALISLLATISSQTNTSIKMGGVLKKSQGKSENDEQIPQGEAADKAVDILVRKGKGNKKDFSEMKRSKFAGVVEEVLHKDNTDLSEAEKMTLHQYLGMYYRKKKLENESAKNIASFSNALIGLTTNILTGASNEINIKDSKSQEAVIMKKVSTGSAIVSGAFGASIAGVNLGKRGVDLANQLLNKNRNTAESLWASLIELSDDRHGLKGIENDLNENKEEAEMNAQQTQNKYANVENLLKAYDVPVASLMKVNTKKTFKKLLTAGID